MPVKVFQVDQSARLMPYAYEQEAIRAAGGEFIIDSCASEADVVERAQDAEILFVSWSRSVTPAVMVSTL